MALGLAYSYSRLRDFEGCPYRFKRLHVDRAKEPPGVPALIGGAVHDILAEYLTHLYSNRLEYSFTALRGIIRAKVSQLKGELADPAERKEAVNGVLGAMSNIEGKKGGWLIEPEVEGWAVERRLAFGRDWRLLPEEAWFSRGEEVYFRAIADWLTVKDGELTVIDHKTGWSDPDPVQLKVYAFSGLSWARREGLDVDRVVVKFHIVPREGVIYDQTYYMPEELEQVPGEIDERIAKAEEAEEFPAVPGSMCSFCGLKEECPASREQWALVAANDRFDIRSEADAVRLLEMCVMVEERLKVNRQKLVQWVRKNGPVRAAGKVLEARKGKAWSGVKFWPLVKELENMGIPAQDALEAVGMSEARLRAILKARGKEAHLRRLLEGFGEVREVVNEPRIYAAKG